MSDQQLFVHLDDSEVEEVTTSLTSVEIGASENSCAIQNELSELHPDLPAPAATALATPHNFTRTSTSCASRRVSVLITVITLVLLIFNVIVIAMCLSVLLQEEGCEPGRERREVVAPLCVPCQKAMAEGEAGGWRRYKQGEGSAAQDMCCPLDHQRLAEAVKEIYHTVRDEKTQAFLENPPEPYKFLLSFENPQNTYERVMYANHYKPSAHMTAQEPFDVSKCRTPDMGTNDTPTLMETVCDWPLRYEPYRSSTRGFVQRLKWGLVVPTTGWYRIHSAVNFYFPFFQSTVKNSQSDKIIPVVHQISRYSIAESRTTALTDHNQTISHQHSDGLTSFLVTLAHLDVGDVIAISVSHRSARAIRDRWHTEGLFLMQ